MCLSTVYLLGEGGARRQLGEYISKVNVSGENIVLSDIMGAETSFKGALQSVDLVKNIILITPRRDAS